MTVLTKPSLMSKKEAAQMLTESPVVIESGLKDEQEADVLYLDSAPSLKRSASAVMCMGIIALLVASAGLLCGLEIYREAIRPKPLHTFQGFCSIPVEVDDRDSDDEATLIEPHYRVPLQWSSDPLQVYNLADEGSEDVLMTIREELDIGSTVEKISVFNGPNGRSTSFIHDFTANVSGIVDSERCFLMDMDRSVLLPPALFVLRIAAGEHFDVARVRDTMRALLPPLTNYVRASRALAERCADRLTYKLQRQDGVIRKRSTDPIKQAHFAHFAGNHVQEIAVANLDELVAFERGHA